MSQPWIGHSSDVEGYGSPVLFEGEGDALLWLRIRHRAAMLEAASMTDWESRNRAAKLAELDAGTSPWTGQKCEAEMRAHFMDPATITKWECGPIQVYDGHAFFEAPGYSNRVSIHAVDYWKPDEDAPRTPADGDGE